MNLNILQATTIHSENVLCLPRQETKESIFLKDKVKFETDINTIHDGHISMFGWAYKSVCIYAGQKGILFSLSIKFII